MKRSGAKLGQHFLKNAYYAHVLAQSLGAMPGETIVEIGPGKGILTKELLKTGARVVAIEKDEELLPVLQTVFKTEIASGALEIIMNDIREVMPESIGLTGKSYTLGANIPYYITGEIIRQFLSTTAQPRTIALLVQKEVAQRIISKKESLLSLSVKAYGVPRIATKVAAGNFSPAPKVDSAILVIEHISHNRFTDVSEKIFFEVLHAGFASKRKQLLNNLGEKYGKEKAAKVLLDCGINPKTRAEELNVDQWIQISKNLANSTSV
jgi:16S rRNA (adenine1518-N6/adenine1519-N6)-dimethyltransferase